MNGRRVLFGLSGAVAVVLAVAGGPEMLPVRALLSLLGNDYLLVVSIGGFGLLVAIPVLFSGRDGNLVQAEMPAPEEPVTVPAAGYRFDETVASWRYRLPLVGRSQRNTVRDRLRTAAVEMLMRTENYSCEEARGLIDSGEWTDDPVVASYLGGADAPKNGAGSRLSTLLRGRTWHEHCARRTAQRIAERGEMA